ncbi:hypothetical protein AK812_SmicGene36442 [Symbiodinium microadriaticum]|uniref:Uncharacterized protein n=1 Tax=Symbiodinium microadriaticum TaxID=2951 RepID=A0A1Q9CIY2_SYMMI|nr:hypothetical protein AK812_SmicGene36442 [Symbiodinium microadriaticum]
MPLCCECIQHIDSQTNEADETASSDLRVFGAVLASFSSLRAKVPRIGTPASMNQTGALRIAIQDLKAKRLTLDEAEACAGAVSSQWVRQITVPSSTHKRRGLGHTEIG